MQLVAGALKKAAGSASDAEGRAYASVRVGLLAGAPSRLSIGSRGVSARVETCGVGSLSLPLSASDAEGRAYASVRVGLLAGAPSRLSIGSRGVSARVETCGVWRPAAPSPSKNARTTSLGLRGRCDLVQFGSGLCCR
jgi:hypothetical protein